MKIELTQIFNNKPYYTIVYEDGKRAHALGYEQTKRYSEEAKTKGEKIELVRTAFLDEHSKLIKLVNSDKKSR